ncbi:MAG: YceI family protein [Candidatus Obscuribacterales bacterium]|jgi:polyisoprenoid-binding protein YceI|nr:YceI family protein [Candidatus Obscuribacterales bacterium]
MKSILSLIAISIAATAPAFAADDWQIDSKHSSANFVIKHMMVSNVHGQIGGVSGTVKYDGKNIDDIQVNAKLDPKTVSTGDASRDEHLRGDDFFQVDKFPDMGFVSTGIIPINGGGFKLAGKLTMHGVTKNVELNVDGPTQVFKDPKTGKERCGATATTTINRKDFGITYNQVLDNGGVGIGEEVKITLDLELHKGGENKKASSN